MSLSVNAFDAKSTPADTIGIDVVLSALGVAPSSMRTRPRALAQARSQFTGRYFFYRQQAYMPPRLQTKVTYVGGDPGVSSLEGEQKVTLAHVEVVEEVKCGPPAASGGLVVVLDCDHCYCVTFLLDGQ